MDVSTATFAPYDMRNENLHARRTSGSGAAGLADTSSGNDFVDGEVLLMLRYGKHTIDEDDIEAVIEVLRSDWLTTGPLVQQFESAFATATNSVHAVSVSSGTAALHAAICASRVGNFSKSIRHPEQPDEVIVPAITFVATANSVLHSGAKPVFADVDPSTLLIDPADVLAKVTDRTRAIIAVDYAGQPCDYAALREIADRHNLVLIADACHSLGGSLNARPVGCLADFSCFSLHPVKQITAGEGGVVTTDDGTAAKRMRSFRNHGINYDHHQRQKLHDHRYAMNELGFNYRLSDIQCALANSQLKKLTWYTQCRNRVASQYDQRLSRIPGIKPLHQKTGAQHAFHLYVVQCDCEALGMTRDELFTELRKRGIGVNVHYEPVFRHPFYQSYLGGEDPRCPNAEKAFAEILSLPIFPTITEQEVQQVVDAIAESTSVESAFRATA
jgi:perosamine synthetase